jgi:hypothetical protein
MKGIQNKKCLSRKLIVVHVFDLCIGKENSDNFFPGLCTWASLWPSISSVMMSIPQEHVQSVLWLANLHFLTVVQRRFRRHNGRQPPTRKSIRFWDNKLRSTGSLFRVKSPGRTRTSEKMSFARLWPDFRVWRCWSCTSYALLRLPPQTILQKAGAPPHFCHHVTNHLDKRWQGDESEELNQSFSLLGRQI